MYKIALLNSKGGVGKSTLAVNLAYAFKLNKDRVLIADADPQGSCRDWSAKNEGQLLPVIGFEKKTITRNLESIQSSYDYAIIDCPSQLNELLIEIINFANLVIIPITPSPWDVWAIKDILDILKTKRQMTNGIPATFVVINRVLFNTRLGKNIHNDMMKITKEYEINIFNSKISQRQVYPSATNEGVTVFQYDHSKNAIQEILDLKNEIIGYKYDIRN